MMPWTLPSPMKKNGSLVIASNQNEIEILNDLMKRGETNGVKNLKILNKEELFEMEPAINPDAIAALYSPDAGNVIPYEFAIALAENAVDNGVELRIRREVIDISKNDDNNFVLKVRIHTHVYVIQAPYFISYFRISCFNHV